MTTGRESTRSLFRVGGVEAHYEFAPTQRDHLKMPIGFMLSIVCFQ